MTLKNIPKYILFALFLLAIYRLLVIWVVRNLDFELNQHMVFGNAADNISAVVAAAVATLLFILIGRHEKVSTMVIVIFAVSAASNVLDRLIYGGVIDYLKFWFIPMFNLADVIICIAVGWATCEIFFKSIKKRRGE